jgi:hypothetical protein
MALCPLAIASKGNANDGSGEYYFALNGAGGGGALVDQSFIATGPGSPPNQGSFIARSQDTVGNGTDAFIMTDISGVIRWGIGTSGVEAGGNSGDNFAVFAYADNGGFLSAPLTINRASGGVAMSNGLTVGNTLISTGPLVADSAVVGGAATVGGGVLQINGPAGLSRVYDAVYNPPDVGADVLLFTAAADGVTPITTNTYSPARTGLHIVSLTIQANAAGFAWIPGSAALLYGLTYNGGANIEAGAQLYCSLITNPAGMGAIGPIGPNVVEYQNDILVNLTAGRTYAIAAASSGAPNLGAGGNVAVVVQPVYA